MSKVVVGTLHRVRKGRGKGLAQEKPAAVAVPSRPSRAAVTLAFAHLAQRAIDRGHVQDRAELARRLGLTRARVTQTLALAQIPLAIQETILATTTTQSGTATREVRQRYLA